MVAGGSDDGGEFLSEEFFGEGRRRKIRCENVLFLFLFFLIGNDVEVVTWGGYIYLFVFFCRGGFYLVMRRTDGCIS